MIKGKIKKYNQGPLLKKINSPVDLRKLKESQLPQLANELGYRVKSLEELLNKINIIFDNGTISKKKELAEPLPNVISEKIFFDDELAAVKIIKIWENIANNKLSSSSNLKKFKWLLKYNMFKKTIKKLLKRLLPVKFNSINKNPKFTQLDQQDVSDRIKKFEHILGLSKKIECKLLSEKTIYIRSL